MSTTASIFSYTILWLGGSIGREKTQKRHKKTQEGAVIPQGSILGGFHRSRMQNTGFARLSDVWEK